MENDRINRVDRTLSCEVIRGSRQDCFREYNPTMHRRHMERVGRSMYVGEDRSTVILSMDFSGNKLRDSNYGL